MRHTFALTLALAAALAGCNSSDHTSAESASGTYMSATKVATALNAGVVSTRPAIASLPDRGELLRYAQSPSGEAKGRGGAQPVSISEAHAFRAIQRKELVWNTPDGERIAIAYNRHEDHGDGNWTWFGRDANGASTVLTFGQDAVFGSISRPDGSELRITTERRRTYAVVIAPDQFRGLETSTGSDYLLVPEGIAKGTVKQSAGAQRQAASSASTSMVAAAANEIDVLLGYSTGLATRIGSASGAESYMHALVATANDAYQVSGVTYRIRLVGTVQVNYTDLSRNESTLEALTGSNGSGSVPIDPAFNALRAAREQTGADLVSFVRNFKDPEQDGCGIAWLLGGQQTPIDQSDASFAYSVVSDGTDVNEADNKPYYCRKETLAHEIGHNMGQAHNVENSTSSGAHAYSYGYRETATTGFYTIMAYSITDADQLAIPYFANPNVAFSGRPTGVANQSDNVRSMNQTMPIIASFRAGVVSSGVAPRRDINGDGRADLLWYQPARFLVAYWMLNGNAVAQNGEQFSSSGYSIMATGDFNGDRRTDIIWRGAGGDMQFWQGNGSGFDWRPFFQYPVGWVSKGANDVDGDGRADLVWYHPGRGLLAYWVMNGNSIVRHGEQQTGGGYDILKIADFNGDSRADIIWLGAAGDMQMWQGNGTTFDWRAFYQYPSGWELASADDVDGDAKDDLIWYQPTRGLLAYWIMNGNSVTRHGEQYSNTQYRVLTVDDFSGDGRADIIWLGTGGDMQMWQGNGTSFDWRPFYQYPGGGWNLIVR